MSKKSHKIAGWSLTVLFTLTAIGSTGSSVAGAALAAIGALIVCPPLWSFIATKIGKAINAWVFLIAGISIAASGVLLSNESDTKSAMAEGFASVEDYRAAQQLGLDAKGFAQQRAAEEEIKRKADEVLAAQKAAEDAACRADLKCWADKHEVAALGACRTEIQSRAKHDYEWTSGIMPVFAQYAWADKEKGSVKYIGDQFKAQNAFGVFTQYRYACHFDPIKGRVLGLALEPGRL